METTLKLTSNVGRDLLASAGYFKKEDSVVWEYVVNSLQYVNPGVPPRIQVDIHPRNRWLEISDNGAGMGTADLERFFTMHGENYDRARGRPGRGKFGTGKSAAFGIAEEFQITTIRDGLKNRVRLSREMIDGSTGDDIPLDWLERDIQVEQPNGTVIEILGIYLDSISAHVVAEYIERHLGAFRNIDAHVAVNDHVCEYREPEYAKSIIFQPSEEQINTLGNIELIIKVSKTPLEKSAQGIAVTAGQGNLVAIEDGGIAGKEFGNFLFGEIDVPSLETEKSKIEPYDASRTLQLNPAHPVAGALLRLIGSKLDEVRRELAKESRTARKTEESRRLSQEASKIAEILNSDYVQYRDRLNKIRSAASKAGILDIAKGEMGESGDNENAWVEGMLERGDLSEVSEGHKNNSSSKKNKSKNKIRDAKPREDGLDTVDPAGGKQGRRSRPKGGFDVEYSNLGENEYRSRYDPSRLVIMINLDHPVVKTALDRGGPEDPNFRRLGYEIAFTEYSMAVGYELIQQDPGMPADDLLYEVRSTLNRVSRSAAMLYKK